MDDLRKDRIGVGIVGASAQRGWALEAHLPALELHPEFVITAVATTQMESARIAATAFGATLAFDSARELADNPDVDLVVVCVKVPDHPDPVRAAAAAGKHVYCEWPLAASTGEAEELAGATRGAGTAHMIGLQARASPAVRTARDLLRDGYVGELLSAVMIGTTPMGSATIAPEYAFGADVRGGMNVLTVPAAHAIDAMCFIAGDVTGVEGSVRTRTHQATIAGTERLVPVTAPDEVRATLQFSSGAVATAHVQGGVPGAPAFRLELLGTRGKIALTTDAHLQRGEIVLRGARADRPWETLTVPGLQTSLRGPAANISRMYADLATALQSNESASPSFEDALRLHRLLDGIAQNP